MTIRSSISSIPTRIPRTMHFRRLNSLDVPPTGTYEFTFDKPGEYAFHCSAHVPQNMFGTILVRDEEQVNAFGSKGIATATSEPTEIAQSEKIVHPPTIVPTSTAPRSSPTQVTTPPAPTLIPTPLGSKVPEADIPTQKFSTHFVRSVPEHADLLLGVPPKIELDFDFTLARNSNINVRKDGEKLTLGDMEFPENRLQMLVNLPDAGAGTYHVVYRACWPDKSCHDGEFAFVVH